VTREGESLGGAIASPYDDTRGYVNEAGIHIIEDVLYVAPVIARSKNIHHILDHFRTDCVMFFKTSTYPKTNGTRYDTLTQYQYLYPFVFYDEGTKLYVSEGKFAGLNDTLFNSRRDLYDFMIKAGGYDLSVIQPDTSQTPSAKKGVYGQKVCETIAFSYGIIASGSDEHCLKDTSLFFFQLFICLCLFVIYVHLPMVS
jgi:hypothetical protein